MANKPKVLLERDGMRFIINGTIFHNDKPDYRLQIRHPRFQTWKDAVLFDNIVQCSYAMEDEEYTKMLLGQPAYINRD